MIIGSFLERRVKISYASDTAVAMAGPLANPVDIPKWDPSYYPIVRPIPVGCRALSHGVQGADQCIFQLCHEPICARRDNVRAANLHKYRRRSCRPVPDK